MKNDELDDLKSAWNALNQHNTPEQSKENLRDIIRRRTADSFATLRRSLLLETVLGVLCGIAWITHLILVPPRNGSAYLAALQITTLGFPALFYFYWSALRHLNRGISNPSALVQALQHTVAYWDQALRLYRGAAIMLMPVFLLSIAWFVTAQGFQNLFSERATMPWYRIAGWIALFSIVAGGATSSLLQYTYGKHVQQLKRLLQELEGG